jgi:hypothetical protein
MNVCFLKNKAGYLWRKEHIRAIFILFLLLNIFFFDVIYLNRTLSSLQVPGVMGNGPYPHSGKYTHRAFIDPGGSTWSPRPHTILASRPYHEGHLPLWNPFQGIGQPLAGNMDSNALNPLRIFLYLTPTPYMWDLYLLFRLLLAGIFAYLFMRAIEVSYLTSIFSAVLFMFCGYFIFSIDMHHLDVEIFLPFAFLCVEKIIQNRRNLNWVILCGIGIFFTIVGGQPQSTFLILSFATFYYFFRVFAFRENGGLKLFGRYLALFVTANLIGFALSAILLFPFYEFWKLSWRNHNINLGYMLAMKFKCYFYDFISFFLPYFLGPINASWVKGYEWHALTRGYVGVTGMLFSVAGFIDFLKSKNKRNYHVLFFGAALFIMIGIFYVVLGFNWLQKIPIIKMINLNKYLGPVYTFSNAVLAGIFLDKMTDSKPKEYLKALNTSAIIIILLILCVFIYFYRYMVEHSGILPQYSKILHLLSYSIIDFTLKQIAMALFFMGVILLSYFLYTKRKIFGSREFKIVIISVAVMEMFFYVPNPGILKGRNLRYDIFQEAPYLAFLQKNIGYFRVVGVDRILYPNFAGVFGIGDIRVLDGLVPKRYMEFVANYFKLPEPPDRFTGDEGIDFNDGRMLDLLGVKFILMQEGLGDLISNILKYGRIIRAGQPLDQWIYSSRLFINGINKKILFAHAPSEIEFEITIPPQGQLRFSIGINPGAWYPEKGDGVLFEICLSNDMGKKTIFSKYIDPKKRIGDRKWFDYSLDLKQYGGEKVLLSFITLPGLNSSQDNNYDWSAWGDIRLISNTSQERLKLVYDKEIRIYENTEVFPRAFVAHQYVLEKEKERILKTLGDEKFDLRKCIILEEDIPDEFQRRLLPTVFDEESQATIIKYGANQTECFVQMKRPGFLVLSDLYYPGWNAYVDGKKEKIYQADYILQSVLLKEGVHTVTFRYEPRSFKMGAWISAGTSILCMITMMGVVLFRKRRTNGKR